ncbi:MULTISPECIES: AarF/UbiB family protein [Methylococcus]|uniref:AarF/UbiB family protein n=1 Tax=Methylococcus capsulatus TaxID=414 RepID=A0ABZ2F7D8_METCP|nr:MULTISPECIES: AarF/UbiB family protein [Methylococcus]MDF9392337.1 universal stress protein [Methylococcus capsulatus]
MKSPAEHTETQRVMVGTDRSETADQAVRWAASFAERYGAELFVAQVISPENPASTEYGAAERTRAALAGEELAAYARQLAGARGHGRVLIDPDPAAAIVLAAEQEKIDVLVVGNLGMAGRKEFLLGNVPNRISHNARCTVVIVNTMPTGDQPSKPSQTFVRGREPAPTEPRLMARGSQIAAVMARHGLKELFGRPDEEGSTGRRRQAKRLRSALEELGPTFSKLGQILSTRPDLLPAEYIEELEKLQDHVPPLTEREVVGVFERELGVPWEDVFESIEPKPLAAGTIAQVHRATLVGGNRIVVKAQRPNAREEIEQDLALLEVFAEKVGERPALKKVIDMEAVFKHLSSSLHRELDFRQEAENIARMREVLMGYDRLSVPAIYNDLSTSRILVMEEIQGVPVVEAPEGPERSKAARQLLESYYKQILVDGFFHADPHPGNLKWWNERIYFLDFGMVGDVGPEVRENLMLLLMAFWQGDAVFLSEVTLMLAGSTDRSDLDIARFQAEIGELMAKYRTAALADMQIGVILQEMCEIALRYEVPMPASLTLIGKALAQVQMATARLDPTLDPFDIAGHFLMRSMFKGMRSRLDPKALLYQSQKLQVRATRVIDALERLVGARPGPKLEVKFRANTLEDVVHRTGHRVALGLTAAASLLAAGLTAGSAAVAEWIPAGFGVGGAVLTLGLIADAMRRH